MNYGPMDIQEDTSEALYDRLDKIEKQIGEIHRFCAELGAFMQKMQGMGPADMMKMMMGGGKAK